MTHHAPDHPAPGGPFGARMLRKEDPRLLRGEARFLDDIEVPPGTLHAVFLRSPHAHARILSVDAAAARGLPGVTVLTADDFPGLGPLKPDLPLPGFAPTDRPLLCREVVRHVGDSVAMVLAEDPYTAEDAAELVMVEYEPLPAVATMEAAVEPGAPAVHPEAPDNVLFRNEVASEGFDAAFAAATHVFRETFASSRVATVSLEPRGCLARHDPGLDETVLWSSTQVPHLLRNTACETLGISDTALRVIAPDVGGGFGAKASVYPEEILVAAAARRLGRAVKWVGDRQDDFLTTSHARDMRFGVEMAMDAEGRLVAVRLDVLANAGAYGGIPFGSSIEAGGGPRTFPGPYRFRHYAFRTRAIATHTTPSGPYRGVAAPIAFLAFEGMMDRAAAALGLTRDEIRRRNLLDKADFPFVNASGARLLRLGRVPRTPRAGRAGSVEVLGHRACLHHRADRTGQRALPRSRPAPHPRHRGRAAEGGALRARGSRGQPDDAGPGPPDHLRPDGRRGTRHPARAHHGAGRRHRHLPLRLRHVREPLRRLGGRCGDHGGRGDRAEDEAHRRPPAGGGCGRHRAP
jgi:carbon-monoxide dehydrogenase large subunit